MKKILITGGCGLIGYNLIKRLSSLNNYEITAVDFKTTDNIKKFKDLRKKVNVVYTDINNRMVMESLIKDHDIIVHLAGVKPPFANLKGDLTKVENVENTKIICDLINKVNKDCSLIYSSSISIYGNIMSDKIIKSNAPIEVNKNNYYAYSKIESEKIIKSSLKKYNILRIAPVLEESLDEFVYDIPSYSFVELISINDVCSAIISLIDKIPNINKKIFNIGGGKSCRTSYKSIIKNLLLVKGITLKYLKSVFLYENTNYTCYIDSESSNKILDYQSESFKEVISKIEKKNRSIRYIRKALAKPIIKVLERTTNED